MNPEFLRTTIVLNNSSHDLQLPTGEVVSRTVFEVLRAIKEDWIVKGRDTTWIDDPNVSWTLERYGRRQLDPDLRLSEQEGVHDGVRLYLVKNASNETYPFLDDDLTEAVAKGAERVPEWRYDINGITFAQRSLAALGVFLSLAAAVGLGWAADIPDYAHFSAAGALGALALVSAALSASASRDKSLSLSNVLAVGGYSFAAAAAFVAIPQEPGLWHILTVTSVVFVYGVVFRVFSANLVEVHAAVLSAATPMLIVGLLALGLEMFVPSLAYTTAVWAAITIFIALLTLVYSSQVSMALGKIQIPIVHTRGEGVFGDDESLHNANKRHSGREATESVINRHKQITSAHRHMIGILLGTCGAMIGSAAFLGLGVAELGKHHWMTFGYATLSALCLFDRGRAYRPADARLIIYVSAGLFMASYVIGLALSSAEGNRWQILAALGAVTVFAVVGILRSLGQKKVRSPITKRWLELLDAGSYFLLLPLLGAIVDIWPLIRNR